METWLTNFEVPRFTKLRIVFLNVFYVLHKAATLNMSKLFKDLRVVKNVFPNDGSIPVYVLRNLVPFFLLLKFVVGFISLAAKVIAMLPILGDDHPEILLPSIFSQMFENLLLPIIELVLGYVAAKYTIGDCTAFLMVFSINLVLKIVVGFISLNLYINYFSEIHAAAAHSADRSHVRRFGSEETFLHKESLL